VAYEQVKRDNSYNNLLIFIKVFTEFLDNLFSYSYRHGLAGYLYILFLVNARDKLYIFCQPMVKLTTHYWLTFFSFLCCPNMCLYVLSSVL